MVNNGMVAVIAVSDSGVMRGQTLASGDIQSHPKSLLAEDARAKDYGCLILPLIFSPTATSSSHMFHRGLIRIVTSPLLDNNKTKQKTRTKNTLR